MVSTGSVIYEAVKPIFKIYIIIGIGVIMARKNILNVRTCRDMSDLVVSAIMPCLIFYNIVSNLKSSDIKNLGIIFFESTLLYLIGLSLAYLVYLLCRSPKRWLGGLLSVGLFPNISDLPIAYLQTLSNGGLLFTKDQGDKGVAYVCIFLAAQILYQFSFGLYQLIEWDFRDELKPKLDQEAHDQQDSVINDSGISEKKSINNIPEESTKPRLNSSNYPEEAIDDSSSITFSFESNEGSEQSNRPDIRDEHSQHDEFLIAHEPHGESTSYKGSRTSSMSRRKRRRSGSTSSGTTTHLSLQRTQSRTSALRRLRSEDVNDIINEYSEFEGLKSGELRATTSGAGDIDVDFIAGPDNTTIGTKVKTSRKQKVKNFFKNFLKPNSVSLIIAIIVAMSPPLKALFVKTSFSMPNAPDSEPPLSFIMDTTSYVGNASVPTGLLLLGACISRLKLSTMPNGFWKTAVAITVVRLIIIPIIGVGLTTGFQHGGWFGDDNILRFVSVVLYGLPNATALVYFTAFYTDPNSDDHLQMDCLSASLIFQYAILCISLPFLVTFTLKVSLHY